jgi:hypothetical protein
MRLPLSLVLIGTAAALTGCTAATPPDAPDPTDESTAPSTAQAAPPAAPGCALVSAAVIKASLNIAVGEPTQTSSGSTISCDYLPADGAHTVVIRFVTDEDQESFARARRSLDSGGHPTTDVPGLVDEAYVSSDEFGDTVTNSLVARKGSVSMSVAAVASVEAEKALIAKVLGGAG